MSMFEQFQRNTFDTVLRVMGISCSWTPSAAEVEVTGKVLMNDPTDKERLGFVQQGYEDVDTSIEYQDGQFTGLFEAVKSGSHEYVTVGAQRYYVHQVVKRYDGKTLIAYIQAADDTDTD